jgi:hypothetical protein
MLTAFGAQPSLLTIREHGERPHGTGAEAAAQERAFRISIAARDMRSPLPAPHAPSHLEWKAAPEQLRAEQTRRAGDAVARG